MEKSNKKISTALKEDYQQNKKEYDEMMQESRQAKFDKAKNKNGRLCYIKLSEMYHNGQW